MVSKKFLSLGLLLLLYSIESFASYRVFYIPLDVETFVPVTKDSIEDQSELEYETDSKLFREIFSTQKYVAKKNLGDITNIRAKFIDLKTKKSIYFDQMKRGYDEKGQLDLNKSLVSKVFNEVESKYKQLCSMKKLPSNTKAACTNKEK